ncbi:MAG: response regulator transcription factor [Bacteroidaceae bacterium]|nr:response regulator transcription factor [Bacteroidaceae bacterium]
MQKRILVVDDELDLREILQCNLEAAGYAVDTAASAEEALTLMNRNPDLLLLDVMMGGMSGFALAEKLRGEYASAVPIIFLTAKDTEDDLLQGFSVGADDYISKPFSLQEVLARVKAVLRRTGQAEATSNKSHASDLLSLDSLRKMVRIGEDEIPLSKKEFGILNILVSNPGRVFSREEILEQVWQGESFVLDRTVDVHIAHVRKKLGDMGNRIVNRQGHGYCFVTA